MKQIHKSLICITTCNRLLNVRAMAWDYVRLCQRNPGFDFVLALDGTDQEYLEYAARTRIPLVYADEREGVCLSKNRVLTQFPDYDYYFFLDDDAQLVDDRVFDTHIEVSRKSGIQHLVLGKRSRQRACLGVSTIAGFQVEHAMFGTGQFTFYTRHGLQCVGGFHTDFAKYKRFGHTEHSYRFVNAGLQHYPFNMILECERMLKWFDPPSVTSARVPRDPETRLAMVEMDIIQQKLSYFPLKIMAPYHVMNPVESPDLSLTQTLTSRAYQWAFPLMIGAQRVVQKLVGPAG